MILHEGNTEPRLEHPCGLSPGLKYTELPINNPRWRENGPIWRLRIWHVVMFLCWLQSNKLKTGSRWEAIPDCFNCVICIITHAIAIKWAVAGNKSKLFWEWAITLNFQAESQTLDVKMQIAKVTHESRLPEQQAANSVLLPLLRPLQLQIYCWKLLPTPRFISMLLWFKCQQQNT